MLLLTLIPNLILLISNVVPSGKVSGFTLLKPIINLSPLIPDNVLILILKTPAPLQISLLS